MKNKIVTTKGELEGQDQEEERTLDGSSPRLTWQARYAQQRRDANANADTRSERANASHANAEAAHAPDARRYTAPGHRPNIRHSPRPRKPASAPRSADNPV